METKNVQLIAADVNGIQGAFKKIEEFVKERGFLLEGDLKLPTNLIGITKKPEYETKGRMKVVRTYINRLDNKVSMSQANRFLHFLFKHIYKLDQAPKIEYSKKEQKIKELGKAWRKLNKEAEAARIQYVLEKGDFYKQK